MTTIIFRPEPVVEPASSQRARNISNIQRSELSAKMFEQALLRAETHKKAESKSQDTTQQLRSTEEQSAIDNSFKTLADFQTNIKHDLPLPPLDENIDLVEDAGLADDDIDTPADQPDTEAEISTSEAYRDLPVFFAPEHNNGSHLIDASGGSSPDLPDNSESGGHASSGGQGALPDPTDVRESQLSNLSELQQLLDDNNSLAGMKEWHFTFEGESMLSELTLSVETDGAWKVGVSVPSDTDSIETSLVKDLQQRLENSGLKVSGISIHD